MPLRLLLQKALMLCAPCLFLRTVSLLAVAPPRQGTSTSLQLRCWCKHGHTIQMQLRGILQDSKHKGGSALLADLANSQPRCLSKLFRSLHRQGMELWRRVHMPSLPTFKLEDNDILAV
eukprot:SAG31_NODE_4010_length_3667_cov_2.004484_6_plen_119_part_00